MIKRLFVAILVSMASAFIPVAGRDNDNLRNAIDSVDEYLDAMDRYVSARRSRIDSVKSIYGGHIDDAGVDCLLDLGRSYRRFDVDSSAAYYSKAMSKATALADHSALIMAMLGLSAVNPLRGIVKESIEMFESVDPASLDSAGRRAYHDAGFDVYLYASSFYRVPDYEQKYASEAVSHNDSLVAYLPFGSAERSYHLGWGALYKGDAPSALASLRDALESTRFGDELYARVSAGLADYYFRYSDDDESAMYYLALSAMSDVAAGTRETTSLQRLGIELYRHGDVAHAYRYLTVALDNSVNSGSRIRTIAEFDALPIISRTFADKEKVRVRWLVAFAVVMALAVVCLVSLLLSNKRAKRRLSEYKERLKVNNAMKDEYIRQALSLCSEHINRMEEITRLVGRKIKAGQAQDLCRMAESGEILREHAEKFHEAFDDAFLKIYPDFVNELNGLLMDDCRFEPVHGRKLTPELRIAAFMRLGIDDGSQIARFLGLSLNTVYTYRNKLRNRAANRADFEPRVMKIGEIV